MSGRLRKIIYSALALLQLASAVPADPTITTPAVLPRQNSNRFIGFRYISQNESWVSEYCDANLKWFEDNNGKYAQCCTTTATTCYAATACAKGTMYYTYPDKSSTRAINCTENYGNTLYSVCNTISIFQNLDDTDPRININCGNSELDWSYYRNLPATATEVATTSQTPSTVLSSPTASNPPTQTAEPKSESKAWIAGAVVGPIAGLALIGLGIFFFLRRKKKATRVPQHGTASMAPVDPSQPPAGVGGYTDAKPQFAASQPGYYNQPGQPDPYAQQGYPQQGGFSPAPQTSPAPQYDSQYPYSAPGSPPLPGAESEGMKYSHAGGPVEIGNDAGGVAPVVSGSPPAQFSHNSQAAELSGGDINSHKRV